VNRTMSKTIALGTLALGLVLSLGWQGWAQDAGKKQTPKALNRIEPLPRDLEIQLALSALPPHLRDNATVYVLNPAKGFEVARKGTNGFHAFVGRIPEAAFRGAWPLTEYPEDILEPISFDKAGAKAQMRVWFDATEMQAKGTPSVELKKIIQRRHKTGYYKAPERAGISYMLSPVIRTYFSPEESDRVRVITVNFPHVMYFAPGVSSEDIGGGELGGIYPFLIHHGHHGYMIQGLGLTERAAINKEFEEMLARLCSIKDVWCLPQKNNFEAPPAHTPPVRAIKK
jgi:hypothetical protein